MRSRHGIVASYLKGRSNVVSLNCKQHHCDSSASVVLRIGFAPSFHANGWEKLFAVSLSISAIKLLKQITAKECLRWCYFFSLSLFLSLSLCFVSKMRYPSPNNESFGGLLFLRKCIIIIPFWRPYSIVWPPIQQIHNFL